MSGPFFPGYDAWKLRSPDDELRAAKVCELCDGEGEIFPAVEDEEGFECPACNGFGHVEPCNDDYDPDFARDLEREKDW